MKTPYTDDLRPYDPVKLVEQLNPCNPPVVVFRANDLCSLGIARSALAVDVPVIWVHYTWPGAPDWGSVYSEAWKNTYEIVNPADDADLAVGQLTALGAELIKTFKRKILILPSSDTVQNFLFDNELLLFHYFDVYGDPTFASYRREVTSKAQFFEFLTTRLPQFCPKTRFCDEHTSADEMVQHFDLPFIIKPSNKDPAQTFYRLNSGRKAIVINCVDDMRKALKLGVDNGIPLIAQELVPFDSVYHEVPFYCFFDKNQSLRIAASGIKRIIRPEKYGTAIALELAYDNRLLEAVKLVGSELKWRGPLMIEFIYDSRRKKWLIIEVNTRPWLFHDFFRRFGLPFISSAILDHRDHYSGQGHLERFLEGKALLTPHKKYKKVKAVHLDITAIIDFLGERLGQKQMVSQDLISFIQSQGDNLTYANGYPADPLPLLKAIEAGAKKHRFNATPVIESIMGSSCDWK